MSSSSRSAGFKSASSKSAGIEDELEALRRELQEVPPVVEEVGAAAAGAAAAAAAGARPEIERVLRELQERLGEAADEAEDYVAAHPFASLAAAFLLGVLVANVMSRGK
jgi:ElaB/YqjD/DUF883 family membrane-anchored ribosome-binding protein